ncbi:MAG: hypothetical protein RLY47_262 [Candidatus Parcubacteria bacterium]|jgi:site-specific recombinase XerD
MAAHSLKDFKQQFLEHLEIEKGRSVKTTENYDRYLTRFFNFAKIDDPKKLTDSTVREFRLWLNRQESGAGQGATLKKKTQNYYLIALRAFLKYLRKRGVESLQPEVIELAKTGDRDLDLMSHAELDRLLAAPREALKKAKNPEDELKALRDTAILELLFSTGMRVSELCSLKRDTDLDRGEFSIRGKGDKVRVVFVSPAALQTVNAYLKARKDMEDAMFVSHPGGNQQPRPLIPRAVERAVKSHAVSAGISRKVTPHVVRHSFATNLLENGADVRSVQALLGHANIATTQVYTHVTDKHLKEIHKAFHGRREKM